MLGISLCLSGGCRNDIESAFNQSLTSYLECNAIRLGLRSQILGCRALLSVDPILYGKDAALKFDKLSWDIVAQETYPGACPASSESDEVQRQLWVIIHPVMMLIIISVQIRSCSVRAGLLLEQAAICFGLSGPRYSRKMQFFLILAGHTFNKSGKSCPICFAYSVFSIRVETSCFEMLFYGYRSTWGFQMEIHQRPFDLFFCTSIV